jgi:D-alanyl-D-alanine carboxypeptidase
MSQSITRSHYRRRRPRIARIVSVEALRAYVEELLAAHPLPGLAVTVTDRDGVVVSEGFGHADLAAGTPVTRETRFQHGSIGKSFTAVLLLQLREQGLVDLDAPVTDYLPWFEVRTAHRPPTLHDLLTHTSGLMIGADVSSDSRYDVWALRESETGFAPGSRFLYSNVGYRTLGFVVEAVAGRPYPEAVRQRILEPLGLSSTDAAITNETRLRQAVGYARLHDDRPAQRSDPWVPAPWFETGTGDGALAGTMDDLAGFLRALLNGGAGLLQPESYALMTTPVIDSDEGGWYGCGLLLVENDGRREIGHGGSMPGFRAWIVGDPDAGLGVAVATNTAEPTMALDQLAAVALELFRDGAAPPAVPHPLAVENAADYAGTYEGQAGRLELVAEGDRLLLDRAPLEPRRADGFLADRADLGLFLLGFHREDDRVVEAVHGGDVYRREGSAGPPAEASPPEWSAYPGHYRAYNPWYPTFRVVLRAGRLVIVFPSGYEEPLVPLSDGSFRIAEEDWSPERIRFDAVADGSALRADLSGEQYFRQR